MSQHAPPGGLKTTTPVAVAAPGPQNRPYLYSLLINIPAPQAQQSMWTPIGPPFKNATPVAVAALEPLVFLCFSLLVLCISLLFQCFSLLFLCISLHVLCISLTFVSWAPKSSLSLLLINKHPCPHRSTREVGQDRTPLQKCYPCRSCGS